MWSCGSESDGAPSATVASEMDSREARGFEPVSVVSRIEKQAWPIDGGGNWFSRCNEVILDQFNLVVLRNLCKQASLWARGVPGLPAQFGQFRRSIVEKSNCLSHRVEPARIQ